MRSATKQSTPMRIAKITLKVSAFVMLAITVIFGWVGAGIASYQTTFSSQPADCVIVLGAGVNEGKPSPVLRARLDHAADLYNSGQITAKSSPLEGLEKVT